MLKKPRKPGSGLHSPYTPEQKARAIQMTRTQTVTEVSRITGIPRGTLTTWRREAGETKKLTDLAGAERQVCGFCGDRRIHKVGVTSANHQQYRCFACKRCVTPESTNPASVFTPEQKAQAIELSRTHSYSGVKQVTGIDRATVLRWRHAAGEPAKPVGRKRGSHD